MPYITAAQASNALLTRRQAGGGGAGTVLSLGPLPVGGGGGMHHHHPSSPQQQQQHHPHHMIGVAAPRSMLMTHPMHIAQMVAAGGYGGAPQPVALMNSASSGNILHVSS